MSQLKLKKMMDAALSQTGEESSMLLGQQLIIEESDSVNTNKITFFSDSDDAIFVANIEARDEGVTALEQDRPGEPQLGVGALPRLEKFPVKKDHLCRDLVGRRMEAQGSTMLQVARRRLEMLQVDIDPPSRPVGSPGDNHITAPDLVVVDPLQVERHAGAGLARFDLCAVGLNTADPAG